MGCEHSLMLYGVMFEGSGSLGIGQLKLFEPGLQIDGDEPGLILVMSSGNYHSEA